MKHKLVYFALLIGLLWQDVCHSLVIRNTNHKQAFVGDKVELQCGLRFSASSEIIWRKLIGRLSDESEESDGKLIIHGVVRQDDGEYECSNVEGQKQVLRLVVLDSAAPVNNNARYVPVVRADVGSTVELRCEFTNMPTLAWKKQNGELSKYKTVYNAPDNRLALHYLTEEDSGIYVCESANGKRSTVTLKVKPAQGDNVNHGFDLLGPEDNEFYMVINKNVGSYAVLECDLGQNTFSEGDEIQWRKNFGIISDNSRMWDNKLEINNLKIEDSGVYECFTDKSDSLKFNVIVKPTKQQTNHPEANTPNRMFQNKESEDNNEPEHEKQPNQEPNQTNNGKMNVDFYLVKNVHSSAELKCNLFANNYDNLDWRKLYGEIPFQRASAVENVLTINNLVKEDSGTYECSLDSGVFYRINLDVVEEQNKNADTNKTKVQHHAGGSYSYSYSVKQSSSQARNEETNEYEETKPEQPEYPETPEQPEYPETPEQPEQPDRPETFGCAEHEATCANGQCIPKSALCNGYSDCSDGSDESNCGYSKPGQCQPNEVSCRNNAKCIPKIWLCDGESECSDNSDEDTCGSYRPGEICKTTEHKCSSGNQCVAKSFLCDDELDCQDGSDEYGCAPPKVTRTPVRRIVVGLGESFKIECTATGFPVPYINWRLNWGHTCDGPRCCATSENGHGILIVTNVQYSDAGAYSCEAINSKGREFAIPDAIVEVVNRRTSDGYNYYNCTHQQFIPTTTTTTTTTTTRTTTRKVVEITQECYCYNHTDQCTCSGICYDCQHNTEGDHCERCKWPYKGDATRGTPYDCYLDRPEPITTTTTTTKRPITYGPPTIIDIDNSCAEMCHFHTDNCTCSVCINCQHNTQGLQCEECKPGFQGDATKGTPHDCQPIPGYVHSEIHDRSYRPSSGASSTNSEIEDRRYRASRGHSGTNSEIYYRMYRPDSGSSSTNSEIQDRMYRGDSRSSSTNSEIQDRMYRGDSRSSSINSEIQDRMYRGDSGSSSTNIEIQDRMYRPDAESSSTTSEIEDRMHEPESESSSTTSDTSSGNDQSDDYFGGYLHAPKQVIKCNVFGTSQIVDGICKCKAGVVGTHCEKCAPSFFHMIPKKDYKRGCLSCFCNGQNVDCTSSDLSYGKLSANFDTESDDWYVSDRFLELENLLLEKVDDRSVEFNKFEEFRNSELFVLVPQKFKGNKLGSFGGNLSFKLTVNDESNPDRNEIKPVEIRIQGSRVNIVHRGELPINVNEENHISINIFEDQFKRYGDNGKVDRDHLMMALSDIKTIMIRASYTPNQFSIKISEFELDVAGEGNSQSDREAKMVEVCSCPSGYTGNSCESCAPGYERSSRGFYLGQCQPSTRK